MGLDWRRRMSCLRVALIDPGDFTPAYDLALAHGLIESGHAVRLIGKHGFREAGGQRFGSSTSTAV